MDVKEILEKIGAEKMVELKIKEKEIEELNKRIDELEKEVKAKSVQLDEAIKLNQKLVVALEEIYAKMGVKASVNQLILHF